MDGIFNKIAPESVSRSYLVENYQQGPKTELGF